ncbi:MAG: hypothetical protein WCL56_10075 [Sediminibacterium sp.]
MKIERSQTIDSLGACQGVSIQNNRIFLYGDREVGMIREYKVMGDSLVYVNKEMRLTLNDSDIINHPTGIAYQPSLPVFIGNSIRLNKEGTKWKAVIYCIDWKGLQHSGKLDGNLLNTIDDDTCIQGTRPEYVQYQNKWFVATADYGNKSNEVRLYDPSILKTTQRTSAKGVLYKKFSCSPWVQNLFWIADKGILVLIQNQIEGRKWRFTYVDLEKSILSGKESVIKVIDINERNDELEGFAFLNNSLNAGVAVTSSRVNNVNKLLIK